MSRRRSAQHGFTLIEVLAGFVVSAIAIAAFTMVVGIAARAWSRGDVDTAVTEQVGRAASRFADDIASAVPWRVAAGANGAVVFAGDRRLLYFAAVAQTGAYGSPRLRLVSYRFVATDGGMVIRREVAPMPPNPGRPDTADWGDPVNLIAGVANPELAFAQASAGGTRWIDTWPIGEALPSAIRLSFTLQGRSIVFEVPVLTDAVRDCQLPLPAGLCPAGSGPPPAAPSEPTL